jgi:hypothetical protein
MARRAPITIRSEDLELSLAKLFAPYRDADRKAFHSMLSMEDERHLLEGQRHSLVLPQPTKRFWRPPMPLPLDNQFAPAVAKEAGTHIYTPPFAWTDQSGRGEKSHSAADTNGTLVAVAGGWRGEAHASVGVIVPVLSAPRTVFVSAEFSGEVEMLVDGPASLALSLARIAIRGENPAQLPPEATKTLLLYWGGNLPAGFTGPEEVSGNLLLGRKITAPTVIGIGVSMDSYSFGDRLWCGAGLFDFPFPFTCVKIRKITIVVL